MKIKNLKNLNKSKINKVSMIQKKILTGQILIMMVMIKNNVYNFLHILEVNENKMIPTVKPFATEKIH